MKKTRDELQKLRNEAAGLINAAYDLDLRLESLASDTITDEVLEGEMARVKAQVGIFRAYVDGLRHQHGCRMPGKDHGTKPR